MGQVSEDHSASRVADRRRSQARLRLAADVVEVTAARLRVIADPTRIRLMEILDEGSASVGGLAALLGLTQQSVSWHLGVLYQAGIVSRRKRGAWVEYELVDWTGWWLVGQIATAVASELRERRPVLAKLSAR